MGYPCLHPSIGTPPANLTRGGAIHIPEGVHRYPWGVTTAFVQGIGVPELLIVLAIVLVIFGPKRLPMLGRQLGSGMREFKDSVTGRGKDDDDDEDDGTGRAEASAALGRPDEAAEDRPLEGEVVSDRR
jgi:sec-independent protein translocase protein TatA